MKLNKLLALVVVLFFLHFLRAQSSVCTSEKLIEKSLIEDIKYELTEATINLEDVLRYNEIDFLGFIGQNKKRLQIVFTSIVRDKDDPNCYLVEGNTTVLGKNLRKFSGEFNLEENFSFLESIYDYPNPPKEECGFSILRYDLSENIQLSSTGIFRGKILVFWRKDKADKIFYDEPFDGYDGDRNYQSLGTWTSYKTNKEVICCWGFYRIPCSDDLDIGASEFSPNEKYFKYGWKDYKFPK